MRFNYLFSALLLVAELVRGGVNCLGNAYQHALVLEYMQQFFANYPDVTKLALAVFNEVGVCVRGYVVYDCHIAVAMNKAVGSVECALV